MNDQYNIAALGGSDHFSPGVQADPEVEAAVKALPLAEMGSRPDADLPKLSPNTVAGVLPGPKPEL